MLKKLLDFDKKYSSLFFCFSLIIIIVFLFYTSQINRSKEKTCTIPNDVVSNYSNYSYDLTVTRGSEVVRLFIKRYNTKYLIEKNENGVRSNYYFHHTDLLEKASNGKYIKYRKESIIDGIDNKLLILDYINEISLKSSVSTEGELTCYNNRKLELSMCINLDDSISLETNDYKIVYDVKEAGSITDFDVDVDLTYEDFIEKPTDQIIDNNVVQ